MVFDVWSNIAVVGAHERLCSQSSVKISAA